MMVRQVTYYEDSKGVAHKTEHEASKADLAGWLLDTGVMNEASAKQLVEHIASGGRDRAIELANTINVFAGTMPNLTAALEPLAAQVARELS